MDTESAAGFWSYAHDDNNLDGGAILELAQLIAEEYNLLSGGPIEIFIDRNEIKWGDAWRERIDSALAQTTFFIPIITPRYFSRPECRRELLEFTAKAKSLGVEELLLPILYVVPSDFSPQSADEAIALVARTNYSDWQENRLLEPQSREYRKAVNVLSRRLLDIANRVVETQFNRELTTNHEDGEAEGIADLVEHIQRLLPEWLDAVMSDQINEAQIRATWAQCAAQVDKLKRAHRPASAIASAEIRSAKELLPLLERHQREARVYLARSIELDPLVSTLVRLAPEHPDGSALMQPIKDAINEAMANIKRYEKRKDHREPGETIAQYLTRMRRFSRMFQKCSAILRDTTQTILEGNSIVRRWKAELKDC